MTQDYFTLAVYALVVAGFAGIAMGSSWMLRPKPKQDAVKLDTYESGVPTIGTAWVRFKLSYYLYALIFVVFDVEAAYLFPWAVAFRELGSFAFIEAIIFIAILFLGLGYAWKEGALEWE